LIAPSSYHRLRFRQGDKEMLLTSNRLLVSGLAFAALFHGTRRGPDQRVRRAGTRSAAGLAIAVVGLVPGTPSVVPPDVGSSG
jgi:hypothetical protein